MFGGKSVRSENSEKECEFENSALFCGTNEHQLLVVHMITKRAV